MGTEDSNSDKYKSENDKEDDEEDKMEMQVMLHEGLTFGEAMNKDIKTIGEFLEGLKYQVQFSDHHMLQVLEQEGGSFLRLVACLSKERHLQSTLTRRPSTWEQQTTTAMFYCSRPTSSDKNT
ncbi:hypothetical protein BU17DRAFT_83333 [Hysterangium stoloniferum]|nr:hypothetical protein BU17DRAFT_83333 [Hysterangium stoloniferum]